jgi:hypothetical protein
MDRVLRCPLTFFREGVRRSVGTGRSYSFPAQEQWPQAQQNISHITASQNISYSNQWLGCAPHHQGFVQRQKTAMAYSGVSNDLRQLEAIETDNPLIGGKGHTRMQAASAQMAPIKKPI